MPKIPDKADCEAEAKELAQAIQQILNSPRYQALVDAFEDGNMPNGVVTFVQILNQIPNISPRMKGKLIAGAFSNKSVSFNWF